MPRGTRPQPQGGKQPYRERALRPRAKTSAAGTSRTTPPRISRSRCSATSSQSRFRSASGSSSRLVRRRSASSARSFSGSFRAAARSSFVVTPFILSDELGFSSRAPSRGHPPSRPHKEIDQQDEKKRACYNAASDGTSGQDAERPCCEHGKETREKREPHGQGHFSELRRLLFLGTTLRIAVPRHRVPLGAGRAGGSLFSFALQVKKGTGAPRRTRASEGLAEESRQTGTICRQ